MRDLGECFPQQFLLLVAADGCETLIEVQEFAIQSDLNNPGRILLFVPLFLPPR